MNRIEWIYTGFRVYNCKNPVMTDTHIQLSNISKHKSIVPYIVYFLMSIANKGNI